MLTLTLKNWNTRSDLRQIQSWEYFASGNYILRKRTHDAGSVREFHFSINLWAYE